MLKKLKRYLPIRLAVAIPVLVIIIVVYLIAGLFVKGFAEKGASAALFWPMRFLVIRYRQAVVERLSKSRTFRYITNLWLVRVLRWILIGPTAM